MTAWDIYEDGNEEEAIKRQQVAGNPVGDNPAFVGRADILREVQRVLRHPKENAIVLYGQRRIGKTSILEELRTKLPTEGGYHPIFFDLQDKAQWPLERVLQVWLSLGHNLSVTNQIFPLEQFIMSRSLLFFVTAIVASITIDYHLLSKKIKTIEFNNVYHISTDFNVALCRIISNILWRTNRKY